MCGLRQDPLLFTEPSHKAVRDPGGYSQGDCQGGELDKSHGSVFILRRRISQLPLLMANGTSQMKQLICKPCGTGFTIPGVFTSEYKIKLFEMPYPICYLNFLIWILQKT